MMNKKEMKNQMILKSRRKPSTPAAMSAPGNKGALPGVTPHYFTRFQDFENLLKGSTLRRSAEHLQEVNDRKVRQLEQPSFVSGPIPYEGTDMTDATNPIPSIFPSQTATGCSRVISRSNRHRLLNNDQLPPTSFNRYYFSLAQVKLAQEKLQAQ